MTKLQKESLIKLAIVTLLTLVGIRLLNIMANRNAQGLDYIVIMLIVGGVGSIAAVVFIRREIKKLDERQILISAKASAFAAVTFVIYVMALSLIAFFLVGGAGEINVSYLPVGSFIGIFISQLAETLILLRLDSVE